MRGKTTWLRPADRKCTIYPEIFVKAKSSGNEVRGRLRTRVGFACLFYIISYLLLAAYIEWLLFPAPDDYKSEPIPFKS